MWVIATDQVSRQFKYINKYNLLDHIHYCQGTSWNWGGSFFPEPCPAFTDIALGTCNVGMSNMVFTYPALLSRLGVYSLSREPILKPLVLETGR